MFKSELLKSRCLRKPRYTMMNMTTIRWIVAWVSWYVVELWQCDCVLRTLARSKAKTPEIHMLSAAAGIQTMLSMGNFATGAVEHQRSFGK